MKEQGDLFDIEASIKRRDKGMAWAVLNNADLLCTARRIAKEIAREGDGTADAQQVGERMAALGIKTLGNWAGTIFKENCWIVAGRTRNSRKAAHAREIKRWRYVL